jgi:hypothetical protein
VTRCTACTLTQARVLFAVPLSLLRPQHIQCSRWDRPLQRDQVAYAATDAYVSARMGVLCAVHWLASALARLARPGSAQRQLGVQGLI